MKGDKKEVLKYTCPWCREHFSKGARTSNTQARHSKVSTQIVCPHCGNFIKTWELNK